MTERVADLSLNWDFTDFRNYDPQLGRFHQVDPLSDEGNEDYTPYNYGGNNPIINIDPYGMDWYSFTNENGTVSWIWREGNAASIKINGQTFQNSGTTHTEILSDGSVVNYNQNVAQVKEVSNSTDASLNKHYGQDVSMYSDKYKSNLKNQMIYENYGKGMEGFHDYVGVPMAHLIGSLSTIGISFGANAAETVAAQQAARQAANNGMDGLLKAANSMQKSSFTKVGTALSKHGNRAGSIFPKAIGNQASVNKQAEAILKKILSDPNKTTTFRHHPRFGMILEFKIPGGQGARFSADGKNFIGFLE
jgi:RHS repeat-associated protein